MWFMQCRIVKTWVKKVTRIRGYNDQLVQEYNAKIYIFGSYRLCGMGTFLFCFQIKVFATYTPDINTIEEGT
ncbi:hypothetical protein MKW98_003777, partial [Papaver atlanticum]